MCLGVLYCEYVAVRYRDFTRLQGNVTKHVNLMSELSDTVSTRHLLELSEVGDVWCRVWCGVVWCGVWRCRVGM
jgi:hypothetical protein